jgi:hypothetical protein
MHHSGRSRLHKAPVSNPGMPIAHTSMLSFPKRSGLLREGNECIPIESRSFVRNNRYVFADEMEICAHLVSFECVIFHCPFDLDMYASCQRCQRFPVDPVKGLVRIDRLRYGQYSARENIQWILTLVGRSLARCLRIKLTLFLVEVWFSFGIGEFRLVGIGMIRMKHNNRIGRLTLQLFDSRD